MSRFITRAVYNGTKQDYNVAGKSIDAVMLRVRKIKELRNASVFLFINRKTGKIVDARVN